MATKVVMEALSPTMEEGRLVKWLKAEGDTVKNGDVLAEVETDKAVMELVARGDGVLRKQLAAEGDSSAVGTLLGVIAGPDENIDQLVAGGGAGAAAKPAGGSGAKPDAAGFARQGFLHRHVCIGIATGREQRLHEQHRPFAVRGRILQFIA